MFLSVKYVIWNNDSECRYYRMHLKHDRHRLSQTVPYKTNIIVIHRLNVSMLHIRAADVSWLNYQCCKLLL